MLGNCKNSVSITVVCNKWKRNYQPAALVILREDLCLPIKDFCPVFNIQDADPFLRIRRVETFTIVIYIQNMFLFMAV